MSTTRDVTDKNELQREGGGFGKKSTFEEKEEGR